MSEFLHPPQEQEFRYLNPLRRYYDSCARRENYNDLLFAAIELYDDQIGDGSLQALLARNPGLLPSEALFDQSPQEAKERFSLLPLDAVSDVVEGHYDENLAHAWLGLALTRIRKQNADHNLDQCLDNEAHTKDHGCDLSELCPMKYVRNFLIADSYVKRTSESVYLQVDQLYFERVANYKRDMALKCNLITPETNERLELDYYNEHYQHPPKR